MGRRLKLPPRVNAFTDRHGHARFYLRRPGHKAVALPGLPWSPPFMKAYHAALAGDPEPIGVDRTAPGTMRALAVSYYASAGFADLRASTAKRERYVIEKFLREHSEKPFAELRREHVEKLLAARADQPGSANGLRRALRNLMQHALHNGWISADPTAGVKPRKAVKPEGFHSWEESEIAKFEARWPIGTRERLAFSLLLYTGQRRGDVIHFGRQHIEAGKVHLRQSKTRRSLAIPLHPDLVAAIEASPIGQLSFITTKHGGPFTETPFSNWFRAACDAAGLGHCSAHGLRKAAARRLAEAGCTGPEIASITGHSSLKEVDRYIRGAEQSKLAEAAMRKVRE